MKYKRATTKQIADVLEQYGPHALLGLPRTIRSMELHPPQIWSPEDGAKIVDAYKLAIARLREQEEELAAARKWQEDLLELIDFHRPSDRAAENWMGWRLFCESARKRYRAVRNYVNDAIAERRRKDEELEYMNR